MKWTIAGLIVVAAGFAALGLLLAPAGFAQAPSGAMVTVGADAKAARPAPTRAAKGDTIKRIPSPSPPSPS